MHWDALLSSTLIPSLSASRMRGVPGVSTLLLRSMPGGTAVPTFDRAWIVAVLTSQWAIGGTLMFTAFALLGWLVAMLGRAVADLNLARRVWGLIVH